MNKAEKFTLRGKTALITGAARRVGSVIAHALAEEGVNIIIHYGKSNSEAENLKDEIVKKGVRAWTVGADFSEPGGYESLIGRVMDIAGPFEILINNASIFPQDTLENMKLENLEKNIRINSWVPFFLGREFAAQTEKGRIINVLDSRITDPDTNWHVSYNLSKYLLAMLTKMSALEFAPGITVNGIAPGAVLPPDGMDYNYLEKLKDTVPLKIAGDPSCIADTAIFLLKSDFITGQVIFTDGGRHLIVNREGFSERLV